MIAGQIVYMHVGIGVLQECPAAVVRVVSHGCLFKTCTCEMRMDIAYRLAKTRVHMSSKRCPAHERDYKVACLPHQGSL